MATLVKVELKNFTQGSSRDDKDKAFKAMLSAFKRKVDDLKIAAEWKRRQFYESKSEKKRRKQKEMDLEYRRNRGGYGKK